MKITKKRGNSLGVALCSGGARGFANIGVLQELEEHGLRPSYMAGSSMGAIIGAMYASGYTPKEMEKIALSGEWKEALKFTVPKSGLIDGQNLIDFFRKEFGLKSFAKFNIPFWAVATNINNGKSVILGKGDAARCIYASLAIPGIFTPHNYKGMALVDGGITNPLPTKEVKDMGADLVLGVDLSMHSDEISKNKKDNQIFGFDQDSDFVRYMKDKFKDSQKEMLKEHLINTRKSLPEFAKNSAGKMIDKFYDPDKIIHKINLNGQFAMFDVLSRTVYIMTNQLICEKINNHDHDFMVKPSLGALGVLNADHIGDVIEAGRKAVRQQIAKIKKRLH